MEIMKQTLSVFDGFFDCKGEPSGEGSATP